VRRNVQTEKAFVLQVCKHTHTHTHTLLSEKRQTIHAVPGTLLQF